MKPMRDRLFLILAGAALAAVPAAAQQSCESLTKLALPNVTVRSSDSVPAGKFIHPGEGRFAGVPAFCRVTGIIQPEVKFEIWMPVEWNRKLLAVGNGGFAGAP